MTTEHTKEVVEIELGKQHQICRAHVERNVEEWSASIREQMKGEEASLARETPFRGLPYADAGHPLVGQLETADVVPAAWRPRRDEQCHRALDRLVDQGTLSNDARVPKGGVDQERRLPDRTNGRQVQALRYGGVVRLKERLRQAPLPLPQLLSHPLNGHL